MIDMDAAAEIRKEHDMIRVDRPSKTFVWLLFLALMGALSLSTKVVSAQSVFGKTYEEVLDKAKREAELRLWWEVPGERGVGEQFEAAFKKRFGFVPRVHLTPVTNPDSLLRFLTEAKVGRKDAALF